jgi:hypothetical protein
MKMSFARRLSVAALWLGLLGLCSTACSSGAPNEGLPSDSCTVCGLDGGTARPDAASPDAAATSSATNAACEAITNFRASSTSATAIGLAWSGAPSVTITVARKTYCGTDGYQVLASLPAGSSSYTDSTVQSEWVYWYEITTNDGSTGLVASTALGVWASSSGVPNGCPGGASPQPSGVTASTGCLAPGGPDSGSPSGDAGTTDGGLLPPANSVTVTCQNNSGDPALVQAALNKSGGIILVGTCNIGNTALTMGSSTQLFGSGSNGNNSGHGATSNTVIQSTLSTYALVSGGNDNTIYGITFDGAAIDLTGSTTGGWIIENNTIQNVTWFPSETGTTGAGSPAAGLFIEGVIAKSPVTGASNSISQNLFLNMWTGGFPVNIDNFNDATTPTGTGLWWNQGLAYTTINGNFFNEMGYRAIKAFSNAMYSTTWNAVGFGAVVSNNDFQNVHGIAVEFQACGGGCNAAAYPYSYDGFVFSGNFAHDLGNPNYSWAYSVQPGGHNTLFINNTGTINGSPTCYFPSYGMEAGMGGGISQGNVYSVSSTACGGKAGYGNYQDDIYGQVGQTNTFQNNLHCGAVQNSAVIKNPSNWGDTLVEQYDYTNPTTCPTQALTTPNAVLAWTSAGSPSFPSGGNATFGLSVTSILSIRQVAFYLDGSPTPVVIPQQLQDLNTNFADDAKWLYHATFDTTGLSTGAHTIQAVATDVSGTTRSISQSFSR